MPETGQHSGIAEIAGGPDMRIGASLRATALAGIATLALGACAPGQGGSNDEPSGDGTIDPASFEGKTLDYAYFTDGPDEQATRTLIEKFEKETGAKVNLQLVPFETLEQTLQA